MASIQKRQTAKGTSYNVVYYYTDENGQKKQKWESYSSYKDATKRKAAIENQQNEGTFLPPTNQTVKEFLEDFVAIYGTKKWGVSMYDACTSLIGNYIVPILGEMKIRDITTRTVDKYIQTLQRTPPVSTKTRRAKSEYVTDKTIEKIIKLLRCAFRQAVRWELISKNPFDFATLPKTEYTKRDIWDVETVCKALDECKDTLLYGASE